VSNPTIAQRLKLGAAAEAAQDIEKAAAFYVDVWRDAYGNGYASHGMQRIGKLLFARAIAVRDQNRLDEAIDLLVRSIELSPTSGEERAELNRLIGPEPGPNLTKQCLVYPNAARGTAIYTEAVQRAIEFVTYGGIRGDIYEFGVLAGWTAGLFVTAMRDTQFYGDLYLFDSFHGLPREKSAVDKQSYDVERGIWDAEMELPESILSQLGMSLPAHIHKMLSRIVGRDRIHIREGFFSESLKARLPTKAAIVHMDCDLYSSTAEVFQALERDDVLQDGTLIMFDDWNCNRGNPAFGQRRALREFLDRHKGRYDVSPFMTYGFNCAAFILHDNGVVPVELRMA